MSNHFGANQNPPWVRQEFANQNTAAPMLQPSVSYPFTQTQNQFAPQQIGGPGTNIQAAPSGGLLPQPGIALPTSLSANTVAQVNPVSYPVKTQAGNNSAASPNVKQRMFTGSVTKMHDTFGFVDEEVFFQVSCIKGMIPKVGDRVLVEATYNANMPFKWNATRVVSLHDNVGNNQVMSLQQQSQQQQQHQQQQHQLKAIQQQALGLMGAAPLMNSSSPMISTTPAMTGGQGLLSNPPGPPPLMTGLNKFQSGGVFNSSNRSSVNTGPGLLGDPRPRSLLGSLKDHRNSGIGSGVSGMGNTRASGGRNGSDSQKDRDRRDRDHRDRKSEGRRKRSRSPVASNKRSHSPASVRSRSPVKQRRSVRPAPRYVVQVPKILLDVTEASVMSLKAKYSNMYVPSDFFHTSFPWVENFPLTRPFSLGQHCCFHIMHKEIPSIKENVSVLEPSDADFLFSAKVMLLASPSLEEVYKKSCCLAEDLPDALDTAQHPARLLQFLVGTRGKNEPMAIGGPWSPSLDGANPQANPQVLIKTAIRTTKALTGIDLSSCTQWYRFTEIRYFRPESKHKDRLQPARVETVVIFLPDVWNCNPTHLEWHSLQAAYQKQLQLKLNPETTLQQEEEEEAETEATEDNKTEPSHFSTLDPKIMKVGDLRKELELRSMSAKGLKSQLVARLVKALRAEEEEEKASKEKEAVKAAEKEAARVVEEEKEKERAKEEEERSEAKKKEEEELQRKEKREKSILERRYKLPEIPSILVHPSTTAKGGKFDCTAMSLSVLLDYRPEDNKEHSFEVSLFAELFNEMLMRDFGFKIYSAIVLAPPKKEEEKKNEDTNKKEKDEKKEKEEKEEKKKDQEKKDDTKSSGEASTPKRRKVEDKVKAEDKVDMEGVKEGGEDKDEDCKGDKADKGEEKRKRKEEESKKTTDCGLLLAFSYFDQNHCGYLVDKDVEDIIHTLGLKLSRAQIKKLVQKVIHRENFKYRKLTDRPVSEKGEVVEDKEEDEAVPKLEPEQLARGNRESLRKLLELSGAKTEKTEQVSSAPTQGNEDGRNFVDYKGSLLDIESLMQKLERSEKSRAALEKTLMVVTDELKTVKSDLTDTEKSNSKLNQEVRKLKSDFETEKNARTTVETVNEEWHHLATDSKTHIMNALNSINSLLTTSDKKDRSVGHDKRSKNDEGKKSGVKSEADPKSYKIEHPANS